MTEEIPSTDRNSAVVAHMAGFLGYVIPFGQFVGPYTVLLTRGADSKFVADHAREALNFQITVFGWLLAALALAGLGLGYFWVAAVLVFSMASAVRAARAASRREAFRYPLTVRLLKPPYTAGAA